VLVGGADGLVNQLLGEMRPYSASDVVNPGRRGVPIAPPTPPTSPLTCGFSNGTTCGPCRVRARVARASVWIGWTDDATGRDVGEACSRSAAFTASAGPSRGAPPEHVEHIRLAAHNDVTGMAHPQPLHDRTRPPIVRFGERDDLSGA
jgi:hypothetical protein